MPESTGSQRGLNRLIQAAFSVPLHIKILGIIIMVTVVFGVISYYSIRASLIRLHYQIHAEPVLSVAQSLASRIGRFMDRQDARAIDDEIALIRENFEDVRYVIVQDPRDQVHAHQFNFPTAIPADLMARDTELCASCHPMLYPKDLGADFLQAPPTLDLSEAIFKSFSRPGGEILEASVPVPGHEGWRVRVGVGDRIVAKEAAAVLRALLVSVVICLLLGQLLALGLVHLVVQPVRDLVETTNRLREGSFETRARVHANDEIGKLANAFNLLAENLEGYRTKVEEKEQERLSLIDRIVEAQEAERKLLARELHDQLGQSLSTVLLGLHNLRKEAGLPDAAADGLEREISKLIDDVRQLAWDMRPSILDDYGLGTALERYVQDMSDRSGIPIDFQHVHGEHAQRLPDRVEASLYRIAQEAIVNIIRHSRATLASVILMQHDHATTLLIEDNGRGFNVEEKEHDGTSLGLVGMRERAHLIGGELKIESEPARGTALRVRILDTHAPGGGRGEGITAIPSQSAAAAD